MDFSGHPHTFRAAPSFPGVITDREREILLIAQGQRKTPTSPAVGAEPENVRIPWSNILDKRQVG